MKAFLKLYAIISVSFIFLIFALIAIYPESFLNFVSEVLNLISSETQNITDLFTLDLLFVESMFSYLFTIYGLNIIANIVIAVFAYLTEDKFNSNVAKYALIVNVTFFFVIIYTAKLLVEGGFKSIRRVVGLKKA